MISLTPALRAITAVEAAIPDCAIARVAAFPVMLVLSSLFGRATTRYPYVAGMIESCRCRVTAVNVNNFEKYYLDGVSLLL